MKRNTSISLKKWFLLSPIVLYITLYLLVAVIAVSRGARLTVVSLLTKEFEDESLRSPSTWGLRSLYVVASHEVEDCDRNPGEFYPNGYVMSNTKNPRDLSYFSYGKGHIYAYDLYSIFRVGFPERYVVSGFNCKPNSQALKIQDVEEEWVVRSIGYTSDSEVQYSQSYEDYNMRLSFNTDSSFSLIASCLAINGFYQLENDTITFHDVQIKQKCPPQYEPLYKLTALFKSRSEASLGVHTLSLTSSEDKIQINFVR